MAERPGFRHPEIMPAISVEGIDRADPASFIT
jgi:hypothetical protein